MASADTLADLDSFAEMLGEVDAERKEVRLNEARGDGEFEGDAVGKRLEDGDVLSETELEEDSRKVRAGEGEETTV